MSRKTLLDKLKKFFCTLYFGMYFLMGILKYKCKNISVSNLIAKASYIYKIFFTVC